MMNAGFARDFIDLETAGGNSRPLLYKMDMATILQKQLLIASNEDVTFHRHQGGKGASCYFVISKWFGNVDAVTVQRAMCSKKLKAH